MQILTERQPLLRYSVRHTWLESWQTAVEFLPIRVFRQTQVFSGALAEASTVFRSSGSTQAVRAEHRVTEQQLKSCLTSSTQAFLDYLMVSQRGFAEKNSVVTVVSLVPPPEVWPQSSLAAMLGGFARNGISVVYPASINEALKVIQSAHSHEHLVVFGTSLHHLQIHHEALRLNGGKGARSAARLLVIDTGGTKGKSFHIPRSEFWEILQKTYVSTHPQGVCWGSEYGMCELLSQAYAVIQPGDFSDSEICFYCHQGLFPFVLSFDGAAEVPTGEIGYLAFIDQRNKDSYAAIITEDLAFRRDDSSCFFLVGRAPDATQKGCSLNVKADFLDWSAELSAAGARADSVPVSLSATSFAGSSDESAWSELRRVCNQYDWNDFLKTIDGVEEVSQEWEQVFTTSPLNGERAALVSAANTPVAIFYPAWVLLRLGVSSLSVSLPSLRDDDPLAKQVRKQTVYLVQALQRQFPAAQFSFYSRGNLLFQKGFFDRFIVFGTDVTVAELRERSAGSVAHFYGFGSARNALRLEHVTVAEAVQACAQWYGRGCLCPVWIVTSSSRQGRQNAAEFAAAFQNEFTKRLSALNDLRFYSHSHDVWEAEQWARQRSVSLSVLPHPVAKIFDARLFPFDQPALFRELESFLGGGTLAFIDEKHLCESTPLSFENPHPSVTSPHQGRTWLEWLGCSR